MRYVLSCRQSTACDYIQIRNSDPTPGLTVASQLLHSVIPSFIVHNSQLVVLLLSTDQNRAKVGDADSASLLKKGRAQPSV